MATRESQKRASLNYYDKNKEEIKKKNRRRYQADPEYRQRKKDINKKYRQRLSKEKKEIKNQQLRSKRIWKTFKVNGKDQLCCRLGHLAEGIDRKSITIRLWIREGKFPDTFKYNKQRYFTQSHYNLVVRLWNEHGNCAKFFTEVAKQWNKAYE